MLSNKNLTGIARVCVSLVYCGAMRGDPNLLHFWLLAGTPVSGVDLLPVLMACLGGRGLELLVSFFCGLVSGVANALIAPRVKAVAPAEESSPDLRR